MYYTCDLILFCLGYYGFCIGSYWAFRLPSVKLCNVTSAGSLISRFIFPCIVTMYLVLWLGLVPILLVYILLSSTSLSVCKPVLYPFNNTCTSVFLESSQILAVARMVYTACYLL